MPSPSLDAWHSSLGGRVHLSPCVSLHLSPVVSPPGCLARLSGWTRSFVSLSSLVSLCLPSFVSRCLPAWMPGWTDSLVSLCLPSFVAHCLPAWIWNGSLGGRVHVSPFVPFICLPFSPSLDAWHGSLGGRVHLSPFVSLDFSHCLPGGRVHLSPFVSLHLSPVVSQPGCLARLSGWTGSFVYLCLPGCLAPLCFPSFVSRCLPAWMPGTVFLVDRFTFLPLSPLIWLLLSPSLDVCHGSPGGRIHLSPLVPFHLSPISVGGRIHLFPFVSLYLSPVVSQPGCLARLSGWTDSFVSRCLPGFGPGFGHSLSCGCWGQGPPLSALHLDFDFAWARGGSSSLSIVGYTLSVRSVPRYQLRSRADDSGALRCAASATRRLC